MPRVTRVETGHGPEIDEALKHLLNHMRDEQIKRSGKTEEEYENDKFRDVAMGILTGKYRYVYRDENGNIVETFRTITK